MQEIDPGLKAALIEPRLNVTIQSVLANVAHNSNDFEPDGVIRHPYTDAVADRVLIRKEPAPESFVHDNRIGGARPIPVAEQPALQQGHRERVEEIRTHSH